MKKLLIHVLKIFNIITLLIPKKKTKIIFYSIPDFSGNSKFLFESLNKKYGKNFEYIWLVNEKFEKTEKFINTHFIENSFLKIYHIITAKYLVSTHRKVNYLKDKNQIKIELWHGMPLKAVSYMEEKYMSLEERKIFEKDDYLIATSTLTKMLLASCFSLNPQKIIVTGQPRNDKLSCKEEAIQKLKKIKNSLDENKKIIFYLPTFREGYEKRVEGKKIQDNNIFRMDDFKLERFSEFLNKNKLLLFIKLHPFEEKLYKDRIKSLENKNIKFITNEILKNKSIDLYEILGAGDLLITDYSSVYFDILMINMPVLFCIPDYDNYLEKRGLLLEPFDFWAPGPKVKSQIIMEKEILKLLKDKEYYFEERKIINKIINKYQDNNSSDRVINFIFNKKNV